MSCYAILKCQSSLSIGAEVIRPYILLHTSSHPCPLPRTNNRSSEPKVWGNEMSHCRISVAEILSRTTATSDGSNLHDSASLQWRSKIPAGPPRSDSFLSTRRTHPLRLNIDGRTYLANAVENASRVVSLYRERRDARDVSRITRFVSFVRRGVLRERHRLLKEMCVADERMNLGLRAPTRWNFNLLKREIHHGHGMRWI